MTDSILIVFQIVTPASIRMITFMRLLFSIFELFSDCLTFLLPFTVDFCPEVSAQGSLGPIECSSEKGLIVSKDLPESGVKGVFDNPCQKPNCGDNLFKKL